MLADWVQPHRVGLNDLALGTDPMNPLTRYLIFGLRRVHGWLSQDNAELIAALSAIQVEDAFEGAVGEIGVHHGKLLILLLLTAARDERAFAVDVFEQQHLNVDRSGFGDRDAFMHNVQRWVGRHDNLTIFAKSSFDVRSDEVIAACGRSRLASVDGGHTEECTLNDLRLIEAVLTDRGVAILDDYFNVEWPGVASGIARYLGDTSSKLRPFAVTQAKMFLSAAENASFYRNALRTRTKFRPQKTAVMFGSEVDIYTFRPRVDNALARSKQFVKRSALGPYVLALKVALKGTGNLRFGGI